MEKFKVIFYPDNKTVEVEKEKTILSAAISAGIYIDSGCGGDGDGELGIRPDGDIVEDQAVSEARRGE